MCRRPKHHWIESILLIKWQMQHIFYLQLMIRSGILPKLSGLTVPFIFPCFLRKNTSFLHWNTAGNSREYKRNKHLNTECNIPYDSTLMQTRLAVLLHEFGFKRTNRMEVAEPRLTVVVVYFCRPSSSADTVRKNAYQSPDFTAFSQDHERVARLH